MAQTKPTQQEVNNALDVLSYVNEQDSIEYMSREDKALQLVQDILMELTQ